MDDIETIIERKRWTADQVVQGFSALKERAEGLDSDERKRIPRFSGNWSESEVTKYLKEVEKAVEDPIKYRNKARLEDIGLKTERISDDALGDTSGVGEVLALWRKVKGISESICDILVDGGLLTSWLGDGLKDAKERLEGIVRAEHAFRRITERQTDERLGLLVLRSSVMDSAFLDKAEQMIARSADVGHYGVEMEYDGDPEKLFDTLDKIWAQLEEIRTVYGVPEADIRKALDGMMLSNAAECIKDMVEQCAERRKRLTEEWNLYASTLTSVDEEASAPPDNLQQLEESIQELRDRCRTRLGVSGLRLLRFLKSEDEFPENMAMEEMKTALESLRPFFMKALREGQ